MAPLRLRRRTSRGRPMTPFPTATEREGRECGCPPGVKWCAHFDGKIVILTGPRICPDLGKRHTPESRNLYMVATGTGYDYGVAVTVVNADGAVVPRTCACPLLKSNGHFAFRSETMDAARDEFRRREAQLLGREQ